MIFQTELHIETPGRGMLCIDTQIRDAVSGKLPGCGLLHIFCRHTSASILLQENADPTARLDLEAFFDRLAPDGQAWHQHTVEGPDDSSAHMKSVVLPSEITLPIRDGQLACGKWQGLFLFEHRHKPHSRCVLLTVYG